MASKAYKYRIHSLMRRLSVEDNEIAWKFLPLACGRTRRTFKEWIYMRKDSNAEIPAHAIVKMAVFFECEPKDLFEDDPSEEIKTEWEKFRNQHYSPCSKSSK